MSKLDVPNGTYEDDEIYLKAVFDNNVIDFNLVNKSNGTVRVLWDNGAYIDEIGASHRILHSSVKVVDKEKEQIPSVIAKGSQFSDNIFVSDYADIQGGALVYKPLLGYNSFRKQDEAEARLSSIKGTTVKLLLPIEIAGEMREYIFSFSCQNAYTERVKEYSNGKTLVLTGGLVGALLIFCEIMELREGL